MAITYNAEKRIFKLDTAASSYLLQAYKRDYLVQLYYGAPIPDEFIENRVFRTRVFSSFSPADIETDDLFSPDISPMEYPCGGIGDFRTPSLVIKNADGNFVTDVRYRSHKIYAGKPDFSPLPSAYVNADDEAETLEITAADKLTGAEVKLFYTVFEKAGVITRRATVKNVSEKPMFIEKFHSACIDIPDAEYDCIDMYGKHCFECGTERVPLGHGIRKISSSRGMSGHSHNAFAAFAERETGEEQGSVYGVGLLYSGNFAIEAELDSYNGLRVTAGINDEYFEWKLEKGESLSSPEAVLVYTDKGIGEMSRIFHRFYNNNLVLRGKQKDAERPLLINSWEAAYFDFDADKIYAFAEEASKLGIDMVVMDDGWFGKRDDDTTSLGDWFVNEKKIKGGLTALIKRINALGVKFGLWFEPEMISPVSELYKKHPDWCIHIDGREQQHCRSQYVLDMSRADVRDYLYNSIEAILSKNNIEYVKWDCNRNITNAAASLLPADRQGEMFHRFVLGTYELLDKLTKRFPDILWESCSGGGGRYDAGMLAYSQQVWCSDNTDPIARLKIQFGTSLCYPASTMGAHVSACTRTGYGVKGDVALWGTFGYELDPLKLSADVKELIKSQTDEYRKYNRLIRNGDLYRIVYPAANKGYTAWAFVSPDKTEALATTVFTEQMNCESIFLKIKGLDEKRFYREESTGEIYSGAYLKNAGFNMASFIKENYTSIKLHFTATEK